jgi:peptidoglycan/LPS O-acetylase OafA/YrhL
MSNKLVSPKYRKEIDGLRTIAVISVIIFHFGFLPNGFLGVDIFFVISGYLIANILNREIREEKFSLIQFYIRRTRRILPLVSFFCILCLLIGGWVMLPDDLENLAQSVIATNFFSNNILQVITTKNYWDVVNEFKPLMHTWSLGVEEQFYMVYPLLFLFLPKIHKHALLIGLVFLTLSSIGLFIYPFAHYLEFYLIPFRFFELSIGGIFAVLLNGKIIKSNFLPFYIVALILTLVIDLSVFHSTIPVFLSVLFTILILISSTKESPISKFILENKLVVFIGKISFSLYMWHQVVLAFGRYFVFEDFQFIQIISVSILILLGSIVTYYLIEEPFRNKKKMKLKYVFAFVVSSFLITNLVSFYIYNKSGVLKDIPELEISKNNVQKNMHAVYNGRHYSLDTPFANNGKKKVLVIGNSFGRDWINVLLESVFSDSLDISYKFDFSTEDVISKRIDEADLVFVTGFSKENVDSFEIPYGKLFYLGTKNFGINNGIFYNNKGVDYCNQRTNLEKGFIEKNIISKSLWKDQYIDLIGLVLDENNQVPVFTPKCKFISQDCRHFTRAGASYFAQLLEPKFKAIFSF